MQVSNGHVVALTYQLRPAADSQEIIDQADTSNPLTFIYGIGQLLPAFEANIVGKQAGDDFAFKLSAADGYGDVEPEMVVDLPRDIFTRDGKEVEGLLEVGNVVPMRDGEGHMMQGTIKEIGFQTVTVDFNHPLAGQDLHFSGQIVAVRPANPDELAHGHAHGVSGHEGHGH